MWLKAVNSQLRVAQSVSRSAPSTQTGRADNEADRREGVAGGSSTAAAPGLPHSSLCGRCQQMTLPDSRPAPDCDRQAAV